MAPWPPAMWRRPSAENMFQAVTPKRAGKTTATRAGRRSRTVSPETAAKASRQTALTDTQTLRNTQGETSETAAFMAGQFTPQNSVTAAIRPSARGGMPVPAAGLEIGAAATLLPVAKAGRLGPAGAVDLPRRLDRPRGNTPALRGPGARRGRRDGTGLRRGRLPGLAHSLITCWRAWAWNCSR